MYFSSIDKASKKLKPKRNKAVAINFISMHTDNAFTLGLDVKVTLGSRKIIVLHLNFAIFSINENFELTVSLCRHQQGFPLEEDANPTVCPFSKNMKLKKKV